LVILAISFREEESVFLSEKIYVIIGLMSLIIVRNIEICAVQIEVRLFHVIVICVYRAPSGNFSPFLRLLDSTLKFLYKPRTEFLICGDINVDYLIDNDHKKLFLLLNTYHLWHTVYFPTRIQNNLDAAIDNIFVDNSRLNSFTVSPIANGLSDHDAQYLILKHTYTEANITRLTHRTRLINNDTITIFQQLLKNETWECIYVNNDINGIFNTFLDIFLNIFESSFPGKYIQISISQKMVGLQKV
jgi:hypothetical protein